MHGHSGKIKMAVIIAEELPELTENELYAFVDIWESHPCLWNPSHRDYKNKAMIIRKLDSLKASFRKERRSQDRVAGAPGRKKKRVVWRLYNRLESFYGNVYPGSNVSISESPLNSSESPGNKDVKEDPEQSGPSGAGPSGDIASLQEVITLRTSPERSRIPSPSSTSSQEPVGGQPPSTVPRRLLARRKPRLPLPELFAEARNAQRAQFHAAATSYLQHMMEMRENPESFFAMAIASDLVKIRSAKRREIVKNKVMNLVHDALMEDLTENEDE